MEEGEVCKRVFDLEYLFKGFNTLINKYSSSKDYVGKLKTEIIEMLDLPYENRVIFIGGTNKKHIRKKHRKEFDKYLDKIPEIIERPTYVGCILLVVVLSSLRSMIKILWLLSRLVKEMYYMLEVCIQ